MQKNYLVQVQNWTLLGTEFSMDGGELGVYTINVIILISNPISIPGIYHKSNSW